jgi:ubiquitin C-terminal hydrolase
MSDTIAVQFDYVYASELATWDIDKPSIEDQSMTTKKSAENLKLEDCIRAFHESEILDEENPWFCPSCDSNQRANKTLTIWRPPETLMVYLKRFIFHDMMPVKVDDPVSYPLDSLDLTGFIRSSASSRGFPEKLTYDLDSVVCHYGGVSAGHYTSFVKHCTTGKWLYFNDSNVSEMTPSTNDERAYILFYRRTGNSL